MNDLECYKCKTSELNELLKGKCAEEFILLLDSRYILCTKAEFYATKESNRQLNKDVKELKSEVEKYRKAFEDAKKECDCQIAECQKKIDDLEHDLRKAGEKIQDLVGENMKLQCERNDYKSKSEFLEVDKMRVKQNEFVDFLPTEPIKVADMLITAERGCDPLVLGNDVYKETYRIFDTPELRQVAEHLLVYCNHNRDAEE